MKNFMLCVGAALVVATMAGCHPNDRAVAGAFLVGNWQSQGEKPTTVGFSMSKNGKYTEEIIKDVGRKNDRDVPSPSMCHYRQSGTAALIPASGSVRGLYKKARKKLVPHFTLSYTITKTELIKDDSNSQNCPTFVTKQNKVKTLAFSREITRRDDNNVADTWNETKFVKINN